MVWHWNNKTKGLFPKFIAKFLKQKILASGFPEQVKTNFQKHKYIRQVREITGIKLEYDKIKYNECKRFVAKIMVNSIWGRLSMNNLYIHTEIVKKPNRFWSIIEKENTEIQSIHEINDHVLEIKFTDTDSIDKKNVSNVALGIFTTSYGRAVLYEKMQKVKNSILYADTDCLIFKQNENTLETGPHVGMLKDEIPKKQDIGNDCFISQFVTTGPKSYAYIVKSNQTGISKQVCKVKGFFLDFQNSKKINFKSMLDLVYERQKNILTKAHTILNKNSKLIDKNFEKAFSLIFDKRIIMTDRISTIPFGYLNTKHE